MQNSNWPASCIDVCYLFHNHCHTSHRLDILSITKHGTAMLSNNQRWFLYKYIDIYIYTHIYIYVYVYIYIYMYENCANNACYLLWGNVSIVRWCIISKRHQLGDAQYLGNCFGAEPTSNEIYEEFSASLYQDEILNEHIKLNQPAIRTGPSWLITSLLPLNKCEWRLQAERVSAAIERSHFGAHQTRH